MKYYVEGVTREVVGDGHVERIGEYDDLDAAVSAAKGTIDAFLRGQFKPGMSAAALFLRYQNVGRVPFIFSDADTTINVRGFYHFDYAMRQCEAICS